MSKKRLSLVIVFAAVAVIISVFMIFKTITVDAVISHIGTAYPSGYSTVDYGIYKDTSAAILYNSSENASAIALYNGEECTKLVSEQGVNYIDMDVTEEGYNVLYKGEKGFYITNFSSDLTKVKTTPVLLDNPTAYKGFIVGDTGVIVCEDKVHFNEGFVSLPDEFLVLDVDIYGEYIGLCGRIEDKGYLVVYETKGTKVFSYEISEGEFSHIRQIDLEKTGVVYLGEYSDYDIPFKTDNRGLEPLAKRYVQQEDKTIRRYSGYTVLARLKYNGRETESITRNVLNGTPIFKFILMEDNQIGCIGITSVEGTYMHENGMVTEETGNYYQGAAIILDQDYFVKEKYDICMPNYAYRTFYEILDDKLYTYTETEDGAAVRIYNNFEEYSDVLQRLSVALRPQYYVFDYIVYIVGTFVILVSSLIVWYFVKRNKEIKQSKQNIKEIMGK